MFKDKPPQLTDISASRFAAFVLACLTGLLLLTGAHPATAASDSAPYPGAQIVQTDQAFDVLLKNLRQAISENRMGLVAQASASRGAASRGVRIPGNAVLMIFRNDYAVRMLAASVVAGIEAPLRIYVTEDADGKATVSYQSPSAVFAPYNSPELDQLALELDSIFEKIIKDAISR
ncbi:MAG: DUF302 domain-containing protein [Gammaproteobacteria bacterium]